MDAGQIIVKINGDTSGLNKSLTEMKNQLSNTGKQTESMTASVFKGLLSFEALKKGISLVVKGVSGSIKAFSEQEKAERRLALQFGKDASIFKNFAAQIQRTTTVGDDQALQLVGLAKSYGVVTGKIQETVKGAIGLSKAYNIDLQASTKAVSLAMQGNFDLLQRYIPSLKTATNDTEKMAMVQKAMADGFSIATDEVYGFDGQLQQLNNIFGDIGESVGGILAKG